MIPILTYTAAAALGLPASTLQRFGVEPSGAPLADDGIVGPRTLRGLFVDPDTLTHPLTREMARLARLGAREEGDNNQGRWPAYLMGDKTLVDLTPEQIAAFAADQVARWRARTQGPWCAGCMSTVIRLAYGGGQPHSHGARELARLWARAPGRALKLGEAEEGDIIAWRREAADGNPAAGHIGVVVTRTDDLLLVLEGNGGRRGGAVGLYGYTLKDDAARGRAKDQEVLTIARRAA